MELSERSSMGQSVRISHHENQLAEKQKSFELQQPLMEQIYKDGFAGYVETLPNLPEAFDLAKHRLDNHSACICCMDEGTPWGVHAAGSGLLLSAEEFEDYTHMAKPDAISSHAGCGAGKIYCQQHGLPEGNSDQIARQWAEATAKKYGLPHVHIPMEEMQRPPDFHVARVCYYDGTGRLNNDPAVGLPSGFVVSRSHLGEARGLEEVKVAAEIIFGQHGFGELLTKDQPFVVAAVASDNFQLQQMIEELAGLEHPYVDRLKIDGFLAKLPK